MRTKTNQLLADLQHARRTAEDESLKLTAANHNAAVAEEAQRVIQTVSQGVQEAAHRRLAGMVSRCLAEVFGDDAYEFVIRFDRKRGKTEARLLFKRGELEVEPKDAAGGGVLDVASFALRLVCLMLQQPAGRRLLVMDEPFKHLSADHRPAVRELLLALSKEMGVQFLLVTHSDDFRMGKVVELRWRLQ